MREEALALLQKGIILFQRKVYDGAMRTLTEYRHHLHGRSPDTTELRIATGLLGSRYGIADLVAQKSSGRDIAHAFPFRTLAAVDARGICITDSLARSICIDIG